MSSPIDWLQPKHELILNPRLPDVRRNAFQHAWNEWTRTQRAPHIGIATSGSTSDGFGRVVALSAYALLVNASSVNRHIQATEEDVWLKALPNFHVGGLSIWARASESGACVVDSTLEKWSAPEFFKELELSHATLISLVPTQLFDVVQAGLRAPVYVRMVFIGGGRLEEDLRLRALALGWPCLVSYGMTECSSQIATAGSSEDPRLHGLDHAQLRIEADDRISVKSDALLTGYLLFDREGRATFSDPKVDGWLTAEDLGRLSTADGGALEILGRANDFIKIGGEGSLVSRLEEKLENVRLQNHYAFDFALLAATDDRLGAHLILISDAAPDDELTLQTLVKKFNSSVMPFEKIRDVKRVEAVPRSALGKLLRSQALALIGLKPATNV